MIPQEIESDVKYRYTAQNIFNNILSLIWGYSIRCKNKEEKDFKRLENILYDIYLDIIDHNNVNKQQLLYTENIRVKRIKDSVADYCDTKEKRTYISNYYKIVIEHFISNQKGDLSLSLTNAYNKILEIDKENQNNKIISKPKVIGRSM